MVMYTSLRGVLSQCFALQVFPTTGSEGERERKKKKSTKTTVCPKHGTEEEGNCQPPSPRVKSEKGWIRSKQI